MGRTETTFWTEPTGTMPPVPITLPIPLFRMMLIALDVYAKDAYSVTMAHVAAIMILATKEEVQQYDYTAGYPVKPSFNLPRE
jgi:hypothetical protein